MGASSSEIPGAGKPQRSRERSFPVAAPRCLPPPSPKGASVLTSSVRGQFCFLGSYSYGIVCFVRNSNFSHALLVSPLVYFRCREHTLELCLHHLILYPFCSLSLSPLAPDHAYLPLTLDRTPKSQKVDEMVWELFTSKRRRILFALTMTPNIIKSKMSELLSK